MTTLPKTAAADLPRGATEELAASSESPHCFSYLGATAHRPRTLPWHAMGPGRPRASWHAAVRNRTCRKFRPPKGSSRPSVRRSKKGSREGGPHGCPAVRQCRSRVDEESTHHRSESGRCAEINGTVAQCPRSGGVEAQWGEQELASAVALGEVGGHYAVAARVGSQRSLLDDCAAQGAVRGKRGPDMVQEAGECWPVREHVDRGVTQNGGRVATAGDGPGGAKGTGVREGAQGRLVEGGDQNDRTRSPPW